MMREVELLKDNIREELIEKSLKIEKEYDELEALKT